MRGLVVPEQTEDYSADPVELFFDLAFVFAFSQLVGFLITNHDWAGVGEAALVFLLLWLPWSQITWGANAVPGNTRSSRVIFLAATALSVPMAASVSTALDDSGPLFAACLSIIQVLGVVLVGIAAKGDPVAVRTMYDFGAFTALTLAVLLAGAFVDGGMRVALWIVALALFLVGTIRGGRGTWTVRAGHFAERHGLIIIVALGEVIVAVGNPLVDSLEEGVGFTTGEVVALTAAGVFACVLWWSYFDRVQVSVEHRLGTLEGQDRGRLARDGYTYAHAPMVAGVILAAAALEEITLHPDDPLPLAFRMMMLGGLGLFFGGVGAAAFRTYRIIAHERLLVVAAVAVVLVAGSDVDGVWLLVAIITVIVVGLVAEQFRIERPAAA